MTQNVEILQCECSEQDNSRIVSDEDVGEICCSSCGTVLKEKMVDQNSNPRTFSVEEYFKNTRNGMPSKISMFDMGNSAMIGNKDVDVSGNHITGKNKRQFLRLRVWDSRSKKNNKQRSLITAFVTLDSIVNKLNIPDNAKENAAYIYRKASEKNIIRGTSIRSMIAASVYASCKQLDIPRSLDEVASAANIMRKKLSHAYRRLVRKLELDIMSVDMDYVSKVANMINVNEKIKRTASKILSDAKKDKIHIGKNPIGVAAASVYISAIGNGEDISMAQIAKKIKISTVTLRKTSRMLRPAAAKYISTIDGN